MGGVVTSLATSTAWLVFILFTIYNIFFMTHLFFFFFLNTKKSDAYFISFRSRKKRNSFHLYKYFFTFTLSLLYTTPIPQQKSQTIHKKNKINLQKKKIHVTQLSNLACDSLPPPRAVCAVCVIIR